MNIRASLTVIVLMTATPALAGDGDTVDSLVTATYDVISGPVGEARDWERFRDLFTKDAVMIARAEKSGALTAITPDGYIERSGSFLVENGFHENEVTRKTERYGDIAQVFSSYEGRLGGPHAEPIMRGINSFQLIHDGERWRIASLIWQQEHDELPLPEEMDPER
jgi:hypothetical protein